MTLYSVAVQGVSNWSHIIGISATVRDTRSAKLGQSCLFEEIIQSD